MKRLAILFFFAASLAVRAGIFSFTNSVAFISSYASYDTASGSFTNTMMFPYIKCYLDGMNPAATNLHMPVSRSGSSIFGDYTDLVPGRMMPFLTWNPTMTVYIFEGASENGGPSSNNVINWYSNFVKMPPFFWNSNLVAFTNEAGLVFSPTVNYLISGLNDNAYVDPTANYIISQAAMNCTNFGTPIPLWDLTYTNGLNTDTGHLGGYNSTHPYPPLYLGMALWTIYYIGQHDGDNTTNIGSLVVDFNRSSVSSTNHLTASGASLSGNTLSLTLHCDRMPCGWTSDAGPCFTLYPMLTNIFTWNMTFTNMPNGPCALLLDGEQIATGQAVNGSVTFNLFNITQGSLWRQRLKLLYDTYDWYGVDHNTLQEVGSTGPHGPNLLAYESNSKIYPGITGTNYVTTMSNTYGWPSNMYVYAGTNHLDAQQTNHTLSVTLFVTRFAPFVYR